MRSNGEGSGFYQHVDSDRGIWILHIGEEMSEEEWTEERMNELTKTYEGFINEGGTMQKLLQLRPDLTPIEIEIFNEIVQGNNDENNL